MPAKKPPYPLAMIHLGQAHSDPKSGNTAFHQYVMTLGHLLMNEVYWGDFAQVIVTGPSVVVSQLAELYQLENVKFANLSASEFDAQLAKATLAVISPGLEVPLQAFTQKVPVVFLPPFNPSQYEQLTHYRSRECATMSIHLSDFYSPLTLLGKNPTEGLAEFALQRRQFQNDGNVLITVGEKLNAFVTDASLWQPQQAAQEKYLASI